ncbi:VanZ family protein [Paenibacillus sp. J5C_2022]|uniref:VanZ family protein n=1 Tax=Paenibacillus sp. J5C2022 TaxID=2977129 RepID=UPI0021D2EE1D|nr:VanZ family protein [Paenibacillus sp. J5C2022]MCU6713005.1 VanZ family protein [Paenibacillus sp. J5C2022]
MHQIIDMLYSFTIAFLILLPLLLIYNAVRRRGLFRNLSIIGVVSYALVIIELVFLPLAYQQESYNWSELAYNFVPFDSIIGAWNHSYYMVGLRNIAGNFVLLLPLALLVRVSGWKKAVATGFIISLSIEAIQLILSKSGLIFMRSFDVDDLILNTAGFFIGYAIRKGIGRMLRRSKLIVKKEM